MVGEVSSLLDDFARNSGIKGLHFASLSHTRFERYLWYVTVLICLGFTVVDVTSGINLYLSHPTATRIKIVQNETLDFGVAKLCVDIEFFRMISPKLFADSENCLNIIKSVGNLTNFLLEVASQLSQKAFQNSKLSKNDSNIRLNDTVDLIVDLLAVLIANVVRAQHHVHVSSIPYNYIWGYISEGKILDENENEVYALKPEATDTITNVALYLSRNGYVLSELLESVGEILCQKMLFKGKWRDSYGGSKQYNQFCSDVMITWLGSAPFVSTQYDTLCWSLDKKLFHYDTVEDVAIIMLDRDQLYDNFSEFYGGWIYIDFTDEPVYFPRSQNLIPMKLNSQLIVNVQVQGEYRRVKTPNLDCSLVPYENCLFACRNRYIARVCRCIPLLGYLTDADPSLKLCGTYVNETAETTEFSIPGLDRCPQARATRFPIEPNCSEKCSRQLCYSHLLTFGITPRQPDKKLLSTYLKIYAETFQFPLMEEFKLYGPKELIGMLGGNLSFYLGINFLILLHSVLYWIQVPIRLASLAKRQVS